jgi:hypothetical protein
MSASNYYALPTAPLEMPLEYQDGWLDNQILWHWQ